MAKKKGNDELDLTPFIGLFAMLIVLLLLTASWSKLYSFKTQFNKSVDSTDVSPPANADKKKETDLKIQAYKNYLVMFQDGEKQIKEKISFSGKGQESTLIGKIIEWKKEYGVEKQITIESIADYKYGDIITIYDIIFSNGMEKIAISTSGLPVD